MDSSELILSLFVLGAVCAFFIIAANNLLRPQDQFYSTVRSFHFDRSNFDPSRQEWRGATGWPR